MTIQAHGSNLWPEPARAGGTPTALAVGFTKDGADWVIETTEAEEGALFLVGSDYLLIDLTPVGGNYVDSSGTIQPVVPGTTARLYAVQVRGDSIFY